ncbi:hypothetical protein NP233_g595 [Leucocoprinus birnbaumii]|uniref:Uncharacterized protein n=1 Tax=Leucocoprinus birnbaumii TaxID=56174 RepID=A0AAD5YVM2_9AGAR|nr:hypothetical protein NP233_g595 [Leucocoprinus birnbaumii]
MAPAKRKYDELDDSDSDEPSFGRQTLPVADLPDDFDGEPTDGMQYLFTVRRNAKSLPQFTRVENPYKSLHEPQLSNTTRSGPHPALPSREWRELSESRWRNIHKSRFPEFQSTNNRHLYSNLAREPHARQNLENLKRRKTERKGQRHEDFAEGRMRAWNDEEATEDSDERVHEDRQDHGSLAPDQSLASAELDISNMAVDEGEVEDALRIQPQYLLPTPTGTPAPPDGIGQGTTAGSSSVTTQGAGIGDGSVITPREPTPQLLKMIDEPMALHLLMYFTFWIHQHLRDPASPEYRLTDAHARWMYSLLLRIDVFVSADDMNLLRNLARACLAFVKVAILERTKGLHSNPEVINDQAPGIRVMGEQACWILISGIVGIWGQRDLWMDVEDVLASLG